MNGLGKVGGATWHALSSIASNISTKCSKLFQAKVNPNATSSNTSQTRLSEERQATAAMPNPGILSRVKSAVQTGLEGPPTQAQKNLKLKIKNALPSLNSNATTSDQDVSNVCKAIKRLNSPLRTEISVKLSSSKTLLIQKHSDRYTLSIDSQIAYIPLNKD